MTYANAESLVKKHQSLVGYELAPGKPVSFVCIMPLNAKMRADFLWHLRQIGNPSQALMYSGFDPHRVSVEVVFKSHFGTNIETVDINSFLAQGNRSQSSGYSQI